MNKSPPLGGDPPAHNPRDPRRYENDGKDDAGGDGSPLDPRGESEAEKRDERNPDQRSSKHPNANAKIARCPWHRRSVSLIGEEQQTRNPRDRRERGKKSGILSQDIAEARDGMAEKDRQRIVDKIQRDQAGRDPRSERHRQP